MKLNLRRSLAATAAVITILATACGGGTTAATPTPAGSAAGSSGSANPIAALKAKVQGKSVSFGVGSPPNLAEVTSKKAAAILNETFGVTVEYRPLAADVEAAAVLSGSLNFGEVALTRLAGLKEGGGDVWVFGTNDYKLDYVLAVKPPITSIAQLKGQPYVDGGNTGPSALFNAYCFGKANMKVDDTNVTHLASSAAVANAFASDQFVGGMIHADALANLQAKFPGKYTPVCFTYEGVKDTNDVFFTTKAWATANPDLLVAILASAMLAARWTYDNKAEWVALAKSYVTNLEAGVAESTYDLYAGQIGLWAKNGALDLAKCNTEMATLVTLGRIKTALDCTTFGTMDVQTQARAVIGTVPEKQ